MKYLSYIALNDSITEQVNHQHCDAVAAAHDATVNAAECLHQIGERHRKTGKFGATGNELTTIRESFALLDTLVSYANRGETIRAMTKMETMIAQRMAELNRQKESTCKSA